MCHGLIQYVGVRKFWFFTKNATILSFFESSTLTQNNMWIHLMHHIKHVSKFYKNEKRTFAQIWQSTEELWRKFWEKMRRTDWTKWHILGTDFFSRNSSFLVYLDVKMPNIVKKVSRHTSKNRFRAYRTHLGFPPENRFQRLSWKPRRIPHCFGEYC